MFRVFSLVDFDKDIGGGGGGYGGGSGGSGGGGGLFDGLGGIFGGITGGISGKTILLVIKALFGIITFAHYRFYFHT
jgi:hypothetical protein